MGTVTAWIRMGFAPMRELVTAAYDIATQCGERWHSASSGKFLLLNSAWSGVTRKRCVCKL